MVNAVNSVKGGFNTRIGNGDAIVWVEYLAQKDYDNRGDFWNIDWDNVRVFLGETDITATIGQDVWDRLELLIDKDLP